MVVRAKQEQHSNSICSALGPLWSICHKCSSCAVGTLTKRDIKIQDNNLKKFLEPNSFLESKIHRPSVFAQMLRLLLVKENMSIVVVVVVGRHAMVT